MVGNGGVLSPGSWARSSPSRRLSARARWGRTRPVHGVRHAGQPRGRPRVSVAARIDLHTHSIASDGTETPPTSPLGPRGRAQRLRAHRPRHHGRWQEAGDTAGLGAFRAGHEIDLHHLGRHLRAHAELNLHDPTHQPARGPGSRSAAVLAHPGPAWWSCWGGRTTSRGRTSPPRWAAPRWAACRSRTVVALGVVPTRSDAPSGTCRRRSKYYVRHDEPGPCRPSSWRACRRVPVCAHPMAPLRGRVASAADFGAMIDAWAGGWKWPDRTTRTSPRDPHDHGRRARPIVTGSSDYHGEGKPNRLGETRRPRGH
ncbi:phosphatase [Kocuria rhizophila]|nr:phosphatase [Kocuria rhizophila]